MAELTIKPDPSLSISAFELEVGLVSRSPNCHKFLQGSQDKGFLSVGEVHFHINSMFMVESELKKFVKTVHKN